MKPSVSGRSAESAAFISEFYLLHMNPTQPVVMERWMACLVAVGVAGLLGVAVAEPATDDGESMLQPISSNPPSTAPPVFARCPCFFLATRSWG